jgi:hypothetical protein
LVVETVSLLVLFLCRLDSSVDSQGEGEEEEEEEENFLLPANTGLRLGSAPARDCCDRGEMGASSILSLFSSPRVEEVLLREEGTDEGDSDALERLEGLGRGRARESTILPEDGALEVELETCMEGEEEGPAIR